MKKHLFAAVALCALSGTANAAVITTNPGSLGLTQTPPFGALTQAAGTSAISTGIDFSFGNAEGVFNDGGGTFALCGINGNNVCDLVTDVDARIVLLNSLTQGLTSYLYAEAGFASVGSLTLSAFGIGNNLLASTTNGLPNGVNGRTTFSITRGTADIAYFRISGADTYGVNQIAIEAPVAGGGAVPEPAAWAMMLAGFGLVGGAMRRRQKVSVSYA